MTRSYEACDLPKVDIDDPAIRPTLESLLTATCGFAYPGAGQTAVLDAIRWLRAHPEAAAALAIGPAAPSAREELTDLRGVFAAEENAAALAFERNFQEDERSDARAEAFAEAGRPVDAVLAGLPPAGEGGGL